MSMILNVVSVQPIHFEMLRENPEMIYWVLRLPQLYPEEGDFNPDDWREIDREHKTKVEQFELQDENFICMDYRMIDNLVQDLHPGTSIENDFGADGELEYDAGYGDCLFWSPAGFAKAVMQSKSWKAAVELEPSVKQFISNAESKQLFVVGILN